MTEVRFRHHISVPPPLQFLDTDQNIRVGALVHTRTPSTQSGFAGHYTSLVDHISNGESHTHIFDDDSSFHSAEFDFPSDPYASFGAQLATIFYELVILEISEYIHHTQPAFQELHTQDEEKHDQIPPRVTRSMTRRSQTTQAQGKIVPRTTQKVSRPLPPLVDTSAIFADQVPLGIAIDNLLADIDIIPASQPGGIDMATQVPPITRVNTPILYARDYASRLDLPTSGLPLLVHSNTSAKLHPWATIDYILPELTAPAHIQGNDHNTIRIVLYSRNDQQSPKSTASPNVHP